MNKIILIKYIKGKTSEEESREVMTWVSKSDENKKYFSGLMELYSILPSDEDVVADANYETFMNKTAAKNRGILFKKVLKYAAVVILAVSVTMNIVWINKDSNVPKTAQLDMNAPIAPDSLIQEVYVVKGAKSKITLPDGSTVWLNSDSRIRFPLTFSKDCRRISFSGEAFFDVVKDTTCPMIVSLDNNYCIKVLGTKFNIRAYDNDREMEATLYSGKINILSRDKNGESVKEICTMKPNETFVTGGTDNSVKNLSESNMEKISAWKEGVLYFKETPMPEVIKMLERWHGIKFEVVDKSVLNYTITAKFDSESAVQILEMLKICTPIDYKLKEKTVILSAR